ncbi:class I adenylate-forming enzyme family protein [Nocardioides sp. GXZ039]|uniref:class I adenylate-forming enzyme family protein n=1 Tax=Nocardioides sp. GXZ039 TaxID=3136018 RepID=UPI0030F45AB1
MIRRPDVPTGLTIPAVLAELRADAPDAAALQIDGESVTYSELADRVDAVRALLQERGVRRGSKVAVLMPNSVAAAVWLLAIASHGAVVVPLNTRLRGAELAYQINFSDATMLALSEATIDAARDVVADGTTVRADLPSLRQVVTDGGGAGEPWAPDVGDLLPLSGIDPSTWEGPEPDDDLLMQFTSGTTAFPKGVMLSHRQILLNARGVAGRLHVRDTDIVCSPSPFFHCAGSTLTLGVGLVSGAEVHSFGRFDPGEVLDHLERHAVTVYSGVEAFFLELMTHPSFSPSRVSGVRTGWIAAPADLVGTVHERMGLAGIVNVYGLSEASPNVCVADADWPVEQRMTCGTTHSGMEVRVVDPDSLAPVGAGTTGIIEVRGPCVTRGYYRDEAATRAAFTADGWLHTGDLGVIDSDGNLSYDGRAKDMLRVGGENVAPAEIEAALLEHPDVREVAVIGRPHARMGEVPAAFVVLQDGAGIGADELSEFAASRLAGFKVPREVVISAELPKTGSGKIQKARLRDLLPR